VALTTWLVDTSAVVRLPQSPDAGLWAEGIDRGFVWISTTTRLELGISMRSVYEFERVMRGFPYVLMPVAYITLAAEEQAVEVQRRLAMRGQHRAAGVADLLLAAVAEIEGHTVLHVDKDFELIAGVTGQPTERLRLHDETDEA